jgi:hypothetical protein
MEFHVLSTKNCRVEQTETNFKLIKDSLHQLREDLHEAEIDFHRKPLEYHEDDEDREKADQFSSSGGSITRTCTPVPNFCFLCVDV